MNITWEMLGLAEVGSPVMISICVWFITYLLVGVNFVFNWKNFKAWKCTFGMIMLFHSYLVIKALYDSYLVYTASGGVV